MKKLRRFLKRLTSWARTERDENRMRSEIEEHISFQIADNIRAGLSPDEARRQAVLKFGAVEAVKEDYRDERGLPLVEALWQDVRYSLRRLRNSPAFTVTVILTLALGIGATTSIFTLLHAVLLKSLAVANPDELYRLGIEARCCYWPAYSQDKEFSIVSYGLYKHFRDNTQGFAELAAFQAGGALFGVRRSGAREPAQSLPGEFVSGNYFTTFGIRSYAGRLLTPNDDRPGAPPVAVMSYRLWRERYSSDTSVIGGVFNFDQKPVVVVGIAPPGFFGDKLSAFPPDFFLPLNTELAVEGDDDLNQPESWLDLIGRIRPGANPTSIEAEMRVELKQWLRSHWGDMSANDRATFLEQTVFLRPGGAGISSMRDQYEHWLEILMIVSAFVLLIVCANVANLMLVRGMERRRQISLSMALGARAGRLVRQALTESILLGIAGGAAGLAIAFAGTRLILDLVFPRVPGLGGVPISASPSLPVLAFALSVSLLTGIAFGIAPAWMTTRVDPIEALRGAGRSTARTGSLSRKTLVVLQAALCMVLLTASGLLTAALRNLENQKFGFAQDRRTIVSIDPRLAGYQLDQLTLLYNRIHDSLSSISGVSAVAVAMYSPLNGNNWGGGVWVDGHPAPGPRDDNFAFWDRVTPGFFDAVGNPILRGRGISERDTMNSQHVAVINEAFARKFFKNEDPIGRYFGRPGVSPGSHEYEVVGIAQDARYLAFDFDKPIGAFFFLPAAQYDIFKNGQTEPDPGSHFLHDIVVVTAPGASLSLAQIRQAMASVDPRLPIFSIQPLKDQVAGQFRQQRLIAQLTSFFGLLSLVLASIGLYGVTAYNAGLRTNEIGVRLALGASRMQAAGLIVRGALVLVASGLAAGLPLTLLAGRFLGSQLYGLNPYNSVVIMTAVLTLGLSALIAALIPARRASSISPSQALRSE
ncbi:MAG TPA: ABC transporter permease [Terriglobia bacterium]|nr:ABC transporter permease [Terriglobia bacterium]